MNMDNIEFEAIHRINGKMQVVAIDFITKRAKCRFDFDFNSYQTGVFYIDSKKSKQSSKYVELILKTKIGECLRWKDWII